MAYRGRSRPFRSSRRRDDNDEDCIPINWGIGIDAILRETLSHIVFHERETKPRILAYLNCFTKLCTKIQQDSTCQLSGIGFTPQEIFCCLRVALLHEAVDVRAAAFRAMRYFMINENSVTAFNQVNLPLLVARSLDVVLENKIERLQALRLSRKLLSVNPLAFPVCLTRSLISIARDGQNERDILTRSCWATIAELMLLNPSELTKTGGFSAIFSSVLLGNQSPQISEALVSCIIYQLNFPRTRSLVSEEQDLQFFLSSFTECYTSSPRSIDIETIEQRELRLQASRKMFVSILRSWQGLIHFFQSPNELSSKSSQKQNGIQTVIESLRMPYPEVRRHILDMLYQLLGLSIPPSNIVDLDDALEYEMSSHGHQEHKQLYNGFICSEAAIFLSQVSRNRLDLFENYLSLVLHSLIIYGLPEALIVVITKPKEESNSTRAAILLGHLLNLSSRLLPLEIAQKCHSLPDLVNTATSTSSTSFSERNLAAAAITFLDKMKLIKKPGSGTISLYLEHVIQYCSSSSIDSRSRKSSKLEYFDNDSDEKFNSKLRDSLVYNRDSVDWDWDVIAGIITWPTVTFTKMEEESHRKFLYKLLAYFKPSSQLFSKLDAGDVRGRLITTCGCKMFRLFLLNDDSKSDEFVTVFLADLMDSLKAVASTENPPVGALMSPTRLISTHSQYYFLFIGVISSYAKGRQYLQKQGYKEVLSQLISKSSEINTKLIISSLDFSDQNPFSKTLLLESLSSTSEGTKIYATNFLRVLLRAGLDDFHDWLLVPLVQLLSDECVRVSTAAMTILDEACDEISNLEVLVKLHLDFSTLEDPGRLLLSRYAGCESGFDHLVSNGCITQELNYWIEVLCGKYVKMVEHILNESMTYHFKSIENSYGRRSDRKNVLKYASLPPHLFGQLVKHEKGCRYLQEVSCLGTLIQQIKSGMQVQDNELEIHKLKSALWTIGHVSSSERGLQLLKDTNIFESIVSLTAKHSVLSIRGTCYYVLGLVSTTPDVCNTLRDLGWLVSEYERDDTWPSAKVGDIESKVPPHPIRGHSLSVSSVGTRIYTDLTYPRHQRSFSPLNFPPNIMNRSGSSSPSHQLTVNSVRITTPCDSHPFTEDEPIGASSLDTESSFTILKSPSKLSPIMSIDSVYETNELRNDSRTIKRHLSTQTPESPFNDAYNFALYVGIQRDRVHSLGLTTVDSMIMHPSPSIANSYCSSEEDFDRQTFDPSASQNLGSGWTVGGLAPSDHPPHGKDLSEEEACWCKSYRGICLPSSLNLIFKAPESTFISIPNTVVEPDDTTFDTGLDLHTIATCIVCSCSDLMDANQSTKDKISWRPPIMDRGRNTLSTKHLEPVVSASATSSSSIEATSQSPSHPVMSQVMVRREILRFVTNLSGSVAARSAEQGLLNMKQKYPAEFQNICLYSEISIHLATYNFRLTSRKFLQELFLDLNFEPLKLIARELLNRKLPIGSGGNDTTDSVVN